MTEDIRQGLQTYLDAMDSHAESPIYTQDFRDGFRHALAMLDAYESGPDPDGGVSPAVREAARLALSRRSPDA